MARIIIIDDDPDILESMKVILESEKFVVETASSGKDGLKKARLRKPDLIILDVMMETPGKGFDVARALRKDESVKKTPVLMLTSIKEATGWDFKKEAGDEAWLPVDDYVEKPLKPDELMRKVEKLLKNK